MKKTNPLSEPAARLREARSKAGFPSAAEAARSFGWREGTYRHHENGTRQFNMAHAATYGRAFKVSPAWLSGWQDNPNRSARDDVLDEVQERLTTPEVISPDRAINLQEIGLTLVKELTTRSFNRGGDPEILLGQDRFQAFETGLLDYLTGSDPRGLIALKADDHKMEPLISKGALLLIDTNRTEIEEQDSVWLFTFLNLTSIRVLRYLNPITYEAHTANAAIGAMKMNIHEVQIRGKVVWVGQPL